MPSVKVKDRECILDIAVITNGKAEAAFELALLNDVSITKQWQSGEVIQLAQTQYYDDDVVRELKTRKAKPATGEDDQSIDDTLLEGVDYWGIEYDFEVQ